MKPFTRQQIIDMTAAQFGQEAAHMTLSRFAQAVRWRMADINDREPSLNILDREPERFEEALTYAFWMHRYKFDVRRRQIGGA